VVQEKIATDKEKKALGHPELISFEDDKANIFQILAEKKR